MVDFVVIGVGFPDIVQTIECMSNQAGDINFLGFLDDDETKKGTEICGYQVIGPIAWLEGRSGVRFFNSIGRRMETRAKVSARATAYGASGMTLIHPNVNTKYTEVAEGVLLSSGVYVEPRTKIGAHTMVLPNTTIGHDTIIGENSFIASGCNIGGGVSIGNQCLIGAGASLHPTISIGDRAKVGVNAVLLNSVAEDRTAFSPPAKTM